MTIEDLISVPREFEKILGNNFFEEHKNSRGTIILTWKDENGQIFERRKVDKHGKGWGLCIGFQDLIYFFFVERFVVLRREEIAICCFSKKSEER